MHPFSNSGMLLILTTGNIYGASGTGGAKQAAAIDGTLIIAVLIILGLAGIIGTMACTLVCAVRKVRRHLSKH